MSFKRVYNENAQIMNFLKVIKPYFSRQVFNFFPASFRKMTSLNHSSPSVDHYHPTFYMKNPLFQLVYGACQPKLKLKYSRDQIFQEDGGHVTLDWYIDNKWEELPANADICLVIHGLTGGSEMNYIKYLLKDARRDGYRGVCFNSRGISESMTSPMPFTGTTYEELHSALDRIQYLYPKANIYLVGASFGGNYLLRYLLRQPYPTSIKGVVCLAPPFNVNKVVEHMKPVYQKFFVKRYIKYTLERHPIMMEWEKNKVISLNKVYNSKNLFQYHQNLTVPIVKYPNVNALFQTYYIGKQIADLRVPTLVILAKDDPIVSIQDIPHQQIKQNLTMKLIQTNFGSHCCWFQGFIPRRWYPRPTLSFFNQIRNQHRKEE